MEKYVVFLNFDLHFAFDNLADAEKFMDLAVGNYVPDFSKASTDDINLSLVYEEVDGSSIEKTRKKEYKHEGARSGSADK